MSKPKLTGTTFAFKTKKPIVKSTAPKQSTKLQTNTLDPTAGFPTFDESVLKLSKTNLEIKSSKHKILKSDAEIPTRKDWSWKKSDNGDYTIQDYKNELLYLGMEGPTKYKKENYIEYFRINKDKIKKLQG